MMVLPFLKRNTSITNLETIQKNAWKLLTLMLDNYGDKFLKTF